MKQEICIKKLVDANIRASSTLFAPSLLDIFAPAPCPNIKPKACNIAINPKTIPTAPVALVPTVRNKVRISHVIDISH